jgi:hypothetical protein
MLLDTYFHLILMLLYGNYMRGTKLKWRHLLFWYTLFWFDPLVPHFQSKRNSHHKFSMWWINNEIMWNLFIQRFIHFYTWIPCVDEWNTNLWMNECHTNFASSYKFICQMCFQCMILVCEMYELCMNKFHTISIIQSWDT